MFASGSFGIPFQTQVRVTTILLEYMTRDNSHLQVPLYRLISLARGDSPPMLTPSLSAPPLPYVTDQTSKRSFSIPFKCETANDVDHDDCEEFEPESIGQVDDVEHKGDALARCE